MAVKYLDETGLAYLWAKIKAYVDSHAGSGTPTPTANATSAFDSSAKMNSTDMTSAQVSDFVDSLSGSGIAPIDYIVEQGTSGAWRWRKWKSGIVEAWYNSGNIAYSGTNTAIGLPIQAQQFKCLVANGILNGAATTQVANVWSNGTNVYISFNASGTTIDALSIYAVYTVS